MHDPFAIASTLFKFCNQTELSLSTPESRHGDKQMH